MAKSIVKPFQFRLVGLFRATAKAAVVVAVLSRVLDANVVLIQMLFPIAAALGAVMVLFSVRYHGTR